MSWGAVIAGGAALVGGITASKGAKSAANASQQASDAAIAENARQFDLIRSDTANQRETGSQAIDKLRTMFLTGGPTAFRSDPGYQFSLAEGQRAIDNSAAARGRLLSGAAVKEGERYATGLADSNVNSIFNRLATIAGIGTSGVNTSAGAGVSLSGQNANVLMANGANRGSAYLTGAAGVNNAFQGGVSNYLLSRYLNPAGGSVRPTGTPGFSVGDF